MSGSVVGTSDLPPELKGGPSCSEPAPDCLNLSSPPMNAPDLALSTPPAERVRAWVESRRRTLAPLDGWLAPRQDVRRLSGCSRKRTSGRPPMGSLRLRSSDRGGGHRPGSVTPGRMHE